jgi:hypothetical protein
MSAAASLLFTVFTDLASTSENVPLARQRYWQDADRLTGGARNPAMCFKAGTNQFSSTKIITCSNYAGI